MPKKVTDKVEMVEIVIPIHTPIARLAIDYPNEGINDIARKVNEIIDSL
jgi:hypothetical protein